MRLFFAVKPKNSLFDLLKRINAFLLNQNISSLRVLPLHSLHLTLLFLGEVNQELVNPLILKTEEELLNISSFKISPKGVLILPPSRPRVFALELAQTEELLTCFSLLKKTAQYFKIKIENRPYLPHITLARIKKKIKDKELEVLKEKTIDKKGVKMPPLCQEVNYISLI
ncbi:MAG: RNA 2',3'-cyclic phosphodiesterase, partial [Candidatus Dadabacteria bacterium]